MRKSESHYIAPAAVLLSLQAQEKFDAIEELLNLLAKNNSVEDKELALNDLNEREKKMSTGLEQGIALPHAKTDAVKELVAAVGISKQGIDFDSLDQQPAHIIFIMLSPKNKSGPHIEFLAHITQKLKNPVIRQGIVDATDASTISKLLSE